MQTPDLPDWLEHLSKSGNLQRVGVPRMHTQGAIRARGFSYRKWEAGGNLSLYQKSSNSEPRQ